MLMLIVIAAVTLPIIVGLIFAGISYQADRVVAKTQIEIEQKTKDSGYNPARTMGMGYKIPVDADPATQYLAARKLAAKKAASLPRGANMRIGRGQTKIKTAFDGVKEDPVTAAKIGAIVGWDAVRLGMGSGAVAAPAAAKTAVPAAGGQIELVPGKDYPVIEITDDMSPAEKRKARIANSKAKSAAMKAAKASGQTGTAVPATSAPAAQAAPATPAAPVVGIEPPQLIEITDDMDPAEVRKARISNSKAMSAFKKALKAAGVDPQSVEIVDGKVVMPAGAVPAAAPVSAAAPAEPAPTAETTMPAHVPPPPELIEITDDMAPDEVRKARIANSKAMSAYKKALKAAGIDPKSVQI
ncbi:MAG: hypothetical protein Kow0080_16340 [Candidatus Promineifilaceae bacterium]